MDADAVQLLNLSPIPELSEVELSTMLEQLSAFSDQNSDITDRNIEDIIKEAEDLIDQSMPQNFLNLSVVSKPFTDSEPGEKNNAEKSQTTTGKYDGDTSCENLSSKSDITSEKNPNNNNHNDSPESADSFSTQLDSHSLLSPGSSANLIKSTIDSLKEYSSVMEKQINEKQAFSDHSPTHTSNYNNHEMKQTNNFISLTNPKSDTHSNSNQTPLVRYTPENCASEKPPKKFNCFERLYRTRPIRVPGISKNLKLSQKPAKFPSRRKSTLPTRTHPKVPAIKEKHERPTQKDQNQQKTPINHSTTDATSEEALIALQDDRMPNIDAMTNDGQPPCLFKGSLQTISPKPEEKLLLRLLQELKEIKKKMQPVGVESREREPEAANEDMSQASGSKGDGVRRLEQQFFLLKAKYEQQLDKLERENERLKGALDSSRVDHLNREKEGNCTPRGSGDAARIRRSVSLGNMGLSVNGPGAEGVKEGFSQTESQMKSVGVECGRQEGLGGSQVDSTPRQRKGSENKENLLVRGKMGKSKPLLEASSNVQVTSKQRKVWSEHETQLMVTLRGVRAEALEKEKENRKLKTEVELLRSQMKRGEVRRGEGAKRCHAGTQTIGLGPTTQRAYDPRRFEVESNDLEKENEELKARITALEDSFKLLKEKRVKDLQLLHKVHEEEMEKLVSKLESQSALTKHLHSLLLRR